GEEAVEIVLAGHRVPGPIRLLGVLEDDANALVLLVGVAPDIEIAVGRVRVFARLLEPRMLVGCVVEDEVGDDAHAALVGGRGEGGEFLDRSQGRMNAVEVGDVVAVVLERGRVNRHEPEAIDAQVAEIVELFGEAAEVAVTVGVAVEETADGNLVEYGVLVPIGLGIGHEYGYSLSPGAPGTSVFPEPSEKLADPVRAIEIIFGGCFHGRADADRDPVREGGEG